MRYISIIGILLNLLVFLSGYLSDYVTIFNLLPLVAPILAIIPILVLITIRTHATTRRITAIWLCLSLFVWVHQSAAIDVTLNSEESESYRLVSLNVGSFTNDLNKLNSTIDKIKALNPDIVVLQEFGIYRHWPDKDSMALEFAAGVNLDYWHFDPHQNNMIGGALFSKYPIKMAQLVFDQINRTNAIWAYTIDLDEIPMQLVNLQLESFNLKADFQSGILNHFSETIENQIFQAKCASNELDFDNAIVCGDFNAVPGSRVYQMFKNEMVDAFQTNGIGWQNTYKVWPIRIDHLFHGQNVKVHDVFLDYDSFSDHAIIVCDFQL